MNRIVDMDSLPVYVEAPARLHLGFLDLEGSLGRRFGSLGLTLDGIATRIIARSQDHIDVLGDPTGRVHDVAKRFFAARQLSGGCQIEVLEQIPAHSGLGSGTQLALAVGTAISRLYSLDCTPSDIAETLGRGARSGVGIGAFQHGGFLLDAGKSANDLAPPVVSRLVFPPAWRMVFIIDSTQKGMHGNDESELFSTLPAFSPESAAHLCHLVLMQILPAVSEQNLEMFSQGISRLQRCIGDYFASAQGGRYTSRSVGEVIEYIESLGIEGVGQSSWGPLGFAFVGSEIQGHTLMRDLQTRFAGNEDLQFRIVSGKNSGAVILQQDIASISEAAES